MRIITFGGESMTDLATQDIPFHRVPPSEYPQQHVEQLLQQAKSNADLWFTPHPTRTRMECVTPNT